MKLLLLAFVAIFFLFSCQVNNNEKQLATLSDSTSIYGLSGDSVKLVKKAGLQYKVKNVEQSLRQLSQLTATHGGAVFQQSFSAVEEGHRELQLSTDSLLVISTIRPQADVTVRIPSTHLEAFLFAAADLGYYTSSSNLQVEDKSLDYLVSNLKADVRNDALTKLTDTKQKPGDARESIAVADEAINNMVAAKTVDADANYSNINLALFQNAVVRKEVIANYTLDDYKLPFAKSLANAFSSGWAIFLQLMIGLAHLWMFILLGVIGFLLFRKRLSGTKAMAQTTS